VIRQMTPTVLAALIDRMSPQELINNIGSLSKRGAMEQPELKALIEQKLEQAKTATRVSAFKASKALEVAGASASAETKEKLEKIVKDMSEAQKTSEVKIPDVSTLLEESAKKSDEVSSEISKAANAVPAPGGTGAPGATAAPAGPAAPAAPGPSPAPAAPKK